MASGRDTKDQTSEDAPAQPDPSVALSLERTLLAWVRTAVSLIGLGIVVAKLGVFLRGLGIPQHSAPGLQYLGVGLIVGGGCTVSAAAAKHLIAAQQWREGRNVLAEPWLVFLLAAVVAAAAAYSVFLLVR